MRAPPVAPVNAIHTSLTTSWPRARRNRACRVPYSEILIRRMSQTVPVTPYTLRLIVERGTAKGATQSLRCDAVWVRVLMAISVLFTVATLFSFGVSPLTPRLLYNTFLIYTAKCGLLLSCLPPAQVWPSPSVEASTTHTVLCLRVSI